MENYFLISQKYDILSDKAKSHLCMSGEGGLDEEDIICGF